MKRALLIGIGSVVVGYFFYWFTDQFGPLAGPMRAVMMAIALGGVVGYLLPMARHREEMKGAQRRFDTLHKETYRSYNQVREQQTALAARQEEVDGLRGRIALLQEDVDCKHFTPSPDEADVWRICGHLEDTGLHRHLEELGGDHRAFKRTMKFIKGLAGEPCLGTGDAEKCAIHRSRWFLAEEDKIRKEESLECSAATKPTAT